MCPFIMLTAKDDDMDKIMGLEFGADDYMTKPFNMLELKARIKTIFRRVENSEKSKEAQVLRAKNMVVNLENRSVEVSGQEISLTAKEFDLLQLFITKQGQGVRPREAARTHLEIRVPGRPSDGGRTYPPPARENRKQSGQARIYPDQVGSGVLFRG